MNSFAIAPANRGIGAYAPAEDGSAASSTSSEVVAGRKRGASAAGLSSSAEAGDEDGAGSKKQPATKRACNECRQQKLKCNVVAGPNFEPCGRCQKHKLECRIDTGFKRIGKRNRTAEMEHEIAEYKRQLVDQDHHLALKDREIADLKNLLAPRYGSQQMQPTYIRPPLPPSNNTHSTSSMYTGMANPQDQSAESQQAVASLLDLKQGLDGANAGAPSGRVFKCLEEVVVHQHRIEDLFTLFWVLYHPFLPFLDSSKSPEHYYGLSVLLFWTIIAVASRTYADDATLTTGLTGPLSRLLWSTISGVTQNYHDVKALCLVCAWPLPTNSTSTDPTFKICGIMRQTALQIGLHRPSHAKDFSRIHIDLTEEDIRDRLQTWAACNIVEQSVSTGYGQPPLTIYDGALLSALRQEDDGGSIPDALKTRLRIEIFSDKVARALYGHLGTQGANREGQDFGLVLSLLAYDYRELENAIGAQASVIDTLYLRAAGLHLHLYAFFESSSAEDYLRLLLNLYFATRSFLDCALNLKTTAGFLLRYAPNYIMHMILAAGFTLLKLVNSFFANFVKVEEAVELFNRAVWAVRQMSVTNNDLPQRLAEVLAQLWQGSGAGVRPPGAGAAMDGSLELKVRCRMSMSLVFDSVWRWREHFQGRGPRGNLDSAVNDPTNPINVAERSENSVTADPTLTGAMAPMQGPDAAGIDGEDVNYDVFDPFNGLLDGFIDFS